MVTSGWAVRCVRFYRDSILSKNNFVKSRSLIQRSEKID